jgi:hypothetical protein
MVVGCKWEEGRVLRMICSHRGRHCCHWCHPCCSCWCCWCCTYAHTPALSLTGPFVQLSLPPPPLLLLPLHLCTPALSLTRWLPRSIAAAGIAALAAAIAGAAITVAAAAATMCTSVLPLAGGLSFMCVRPVLTLSFVYCISTCKTKISVLEM